MNQLININIFVPEEILLSLRTEANEFATTMKRMAALKLYENGKLSIGQAASLAEMDELDFIRFLSQNRISIFGSASDIAEDFANA
jgi:predicted HTH domain antitoxin